MLHRRYQLGVMLASLVYTSAVITGCSSGTTPTMPSAPNALPMRPVSTTGVIFTARWSGSFARDSLTVAVSSNGTPLGTAVRADAPASGTKNSTTIAVAAPPGIDTFHIVLYARNRAVGSADVTRQIVSAHRNALTVNVGGVVSAVTVMPVANQPFVEIPSSPDPGTQTFILVGDMPQLFHATGVDARGDAIVPAPKITMDGYEGDMAAQMLSTSSNWSVHFDSNTVAGDGALHGGGAVVLDATDTHGDEASSTIDVRLSPAIYVGYATTHGGHPPIAVYDGHGKAIALPRAAFAGLQKPTVFAWDPPDGELLVAGGSSGTLFAFDGLGAPVAHFSSPAIKGVTSITYSTTLNAFYVTSATGVYAVTKTGTATKAGFTSDTAPYGITSVDVAYAVPGSSFEHGLLAGDAVSAKIYAYDSQNDRLGTFLGRCAKPVVAFASTGNARQDGGLYEVCPGANGDDLFNFRMPMGAVSPTWNSYRVVHSASGVHAAAIAVDPTTTGVYYVDQSANAIVWLDRDLRSRADRRIATPPDLGLSSPDTIAISPAYE